MQILINTRAIRAVSHCAAGKDMRYYLNGVHIEASAVETIVTATDGHTLATYREKNENTLDNPVELIIPIDVIKEIKGGRQSNSFLALESDDGQTWMLHGANKTGRPILFTPIDGKYPDWRRVIPKEPASRAVATFDPELLMHFVKAGKEFGLRHPVPELAHNGSGTAGVSIGIDGFFGAIVPRRDNNAAPWNGADPAVYAPLAQPEVVEETEAAEA